jgi:hypothetical protein
MRFVLSKKNVVVSILAAAIFGLLLSNLVPWSVSAPEVGDSVRAVTVSPFAMMMKAPLGLPIEQYDAH